MSTPSAAQVAQAKNLGCRFTGAGGHRHRTNADGVMWGPAVGCVMGSILIQIATNLANDYFDHKKGADTEERVGPARAVQQGWISPRAMATATVISLLLALLVGLYLIAVGGWPIAVIGIVSLICAVAYTGGPFPLAYLGLGDIFVFAFFGLAAVVGTSFVQLLFVPPSAWFAGAAIGLLATAILVVNNLRDRETDAKANKRTLAVRFGARMARVEHMACFVLAYLLVTIAVFMQLAPPLWLLVWLSVPLAIIEVRAGSKDGPALNEHLAPPGSNWYSAIALRRSHPVIALHPFSLPPSRPFTSSKGSFPREKASWSRSKPANSLAGEAPPSGPQPGTLKVHTELAHVQEHNEPLPKTIEDTGPAEDKHRGGATCIGHRDLGCNGQWSNRPIAQLLNRNARKEIPISHLYTNDDALFHAKVLGTQLVKIKVGAKLDEDVQRIAHIRDIVGPDIPFRADANGGVDGTEAELAIDRLRPVQSIEEPVANRDLQAMARLRGHGVRIAADESVRSLCDLEAIVHHQAADDIVIKPMLIGRRWHSICSKGPTKKRWAWVTTTIDGAVGRMMAGTLRLQHPSGICTLVDSIPPRG